VAGAIKSFASEHHGPDKAARRASSHEMHSVSMLGRGAAGAAVRGARQLTGAAVHGVIGGSERVRAKVFRTRRGSEGGIGSDEEEEAALGAHGDVSAHIMALDLGGSSPVRGSMRRPVARSEGHSSASGTGIGGGDDDGSDGSVGSGRHSEVDEAGGDGVRVRDMKQVHRRDAGWQQQRKEQFRTRHGNEHRAGRDHHAAAGKVIGASADDRDARGVGVAVGATKGSTGGGGKRPGGGKKQVVSTATTKGSAAASATATAPQRSDAQSAAAADATLEAAGVGGGGGGGGGRRKRSSGLRAAAVSAEASAEASGEASADAKANDSAVQVAAPASTGVVGRRGSSRRKRSTASNASASDAVSAADAPAATAAVDAEH